MQSSWIWKNILRPAIDDSKLSWDDAVAIYRCLFYSDQIADVSLGNIFRFNIEELLKEV
jgi:hypothetical protein